MLFFAGSGSELEASDNISGLAPISVGSISPRAAAAMKAASPASSCTYSISSVRYAESRCSRSSAARFASWSLPLISVIDLVAACFASAIMTRLGWRSHRVGAPRLAPLPLSSGTERGQPAPCACPARALQSVQMSGQSPVICQGRLLTGDPAPQLLHGTLPVVGGFDGGNLFGPGWGSRYRLPELPE